MRAKNALSNTSIVMASSTYAMPRTASYASYQCHRKCGEPAESIDSRSSTINHSLLSWLSLVSKHTPAWRRRCPGKTGSWRKASDISPQPGFKPIRHTQTVAMGRHARMVFLFTNCQDHSSHDKGNKQNQHSKVAATHARRCGHRALSLTEGKQRRGTPSTNTQGPVHTCSVHRLGLVPFHLHLADEFCDQLRITREREGW